VRRLASIAARTVGRRVLLKNGGVGTVTRVTAQGLTVSIPGILPEHIERWLDD
jgi:preprotein translocase subunit YajC